MTEEELDLVLGDDVDSWALVEFSRIRDGHLPHDTTPGLEVKDYPLVLRKAARMVLGQKLSPFNAAKLLNAAGLMLSHAQDKNAELADKAWKYDELCK